MLMLLTVGCDEALGIPRFFGGVSKLLLPQILSTLASSFLLVSTHRIKKVLKSCSYARGRARLSTFPPPTAPALR
jgi:hypothetical protein